MGGWKGISLAIVANSGVIGYLVGKYEDSQSEFWKASVETLWLDKCLPRRWTQSRVTPIGHVLDNRKDYERRKAKYERGTLVGDFRTHSFRLIGQGSNFCLHRMRIELSWLS